MLRAVVCGAIGLAALIGVLLAVGVGAQSSPITLEERTTSSLSVRWNWGGQTAAAFEVAWRPRGEDDRAAWRSARKRASERRHTIGGLDAGVHYVVRVRALNAAGRPLGDLRAAFATDWSAPRLLRVTARADAALTISWTAPNGWSPQGYRLRWRAAGAQTLSGDLTLPASANSRRLPGLSTGTAYLIRLTALNARGGESPPAVLTATAAGAPPAQPVLTDASWSELTLRAEWDAVARATGYDVRWSSADDQTPVSAEEAIETSPAEYIAPRTGLYTVAVRARIGSGPSAVRGEWSQPLSLRVLPPPGYLRVQHFDGERVRLTWPGVGSNGYVVEWGRRGGAKQTETRDGRSGVLEVGPLTAIAAYEFRVRARHQRGQSGWSPTATMTPTVWPQLPPRAALNQGSLYVLWPPAAGAEWYEAQWINAADRDETARVRVDPPGGAGNVAARIGRDGGFEDGRWLVRVRAGPFGLWSQTYALDLAGQPPRLALELESSRDLCTAGTLTEVSWKISGGSAPYALSVENSAVDVSADNVRVNCGALTEAEAGDAEAALAAKTVSAVVTDSRGVQRQAALDVARARALPAPADFGATGHRTYILSSWTPAGPGGPGVEHSYVLRWRRQGAAQWTFVHQSFISKMLGPPRDARSIDNLSEATVYELSVADTRTAIESETPEALNWTPVQAVTTLTAATNVRATATHDTITVRWDPQPAPDVVYWVSAHSLEGSGSAGELVRLSPTDRHEVTLRGLPPDTEYGVAVRLNAGDQAQITNAPAPIRTLPAPPDWTAPLRGAQNVRATATHNSITVRWDPPRAGALPLYIVFLFRAHDFIDGEEVKVRHVEVFDATSVRLDNLDPSTAYRVVISHRDTVVRDQDVAISTTAAPAATGAADAAVVPTPPYIPQPALSDLGWPVHLDTQRRLTADVWEWRPRPYGERHHAGLDVGHLIGGNAVELRDDPVIASAKGVLRIFNDVEPKDYQYVLYCPSAPGLIYERFVLWDEEGMTSSDGEYACRYVISPASGRTALVFHGDHGAGPYFTKYAHLAEIKLEQKTRQRAVESSDGEVIGYRIERGERIGHIGSSSDDDFHAHLHFEIRHMPAATWPLKLWYTAEEQALTCASGTGVMSDCEWASNRSMLSVVDPEDLLPPYPAAPFWKDAYGEQPFTATAPVTLAAASPATSPAGQVNVRLQVLVHRPEFYRLAEGPVYRAGLTGRARTRPGVTNYTIRSTCVEGQDQRTAATRQLAYVANDGLKNVSLAMVSGMTCDVSVITGNNAHSTGSVPTGLYGREFSVLSLTDGNRVSVGSRHAAPEHPSTRVSMASLRGSSSTVLGNLAPYEVDVYMLEAQQGYTYRFCVDLDKNGDCNDRPTGPTAEIEEDVVVQLVDADGVVRRSSGANVEDTRDGEADLEWTAGSPGTYALVIRAGTYCNAVEGPCTGDYTLLYDETLKTVCTPSSGGPIGASEGAAGAVDDGGGGSTTPCRPQAPTALTAGTRTPVRLTLSWTAGVGASFHEVKATTRTNCDLESEAYGTPSPKSATSHSFTGLTPNASYRLCVRSVRTIGSDSVRSAWASVPMATTAKLATPSVRSIPSSDVTTNSVTLRWSTVDDADGYEVKRTEGSGETTPGPAATTSSHPFTGLSSSTPYTFYVRAKLSTHSTVTSAWAPAQATTSSPPTTPPPPPAFTLDAEISSNSCYITESVRVTWSTRNGFGDVTVTINDGDVTTSPITVRCRTTAGSQKIVVSAEDSTGASDRSEFDVTVNEAQSLVECLIHTEYGGTALYYRGSVCLGATASALWSGLASANVAVGCISMWSTSSQRFLRYQSGWADFNLVIRDLLILSRSACPSDDVSGASAEGLPACPDAAPAASGPRIVRVGEASCVVVRGGGAAQVSDGSHTLNLTLPAGRDWALFASSALEGDDAGLFWFLDLTTGGWVALNPADGAELARHAPADADGLPALLDAIAASAAAPPAAE